MKTPKRATYLLREEHPIYPVIKVHFNTRLVTLQDGDNSFNTVNIKNVRFDFTDFTKEERDKFMNSFNSLEDMCKKK